MKKILLVDDEKGVVAMMKSYFEMSGYQVLTAYNGAEALRQAVHQPDIILLDINMPGMDGLTVCKKIRDYISCPILFLTARIETADKIKGFQVGADDYIIKPFDIDELGARVAAHLRRENRKQGQSELRFFSEMVIDYSKREVKLPMLFASVAVTLIFAMLAAFPAARYASRVSPTVAMSGQTVKIRRRVKKNRTIRNFDAYYARLSLKRGRGRTVVTILSLVMSITVFVALQSFTGLLDASSSIQNMYSGDYAITNETVGIPAEAVKTLEANDAVEGVSTTRLSVFMPGAGDVLPFETDLSVQSHETLQLASVDEGQFRTYAPDLSEEDKQALNDGTGCLIQNPIAFSYGDTGIQQTNLAVGDTIRLGDKIVRVVGLTDTPVIINNAGFTNGVQIIVNGELYSYLLGDDSYSEIYPTLKENADADAFESWLDNWCSEQPGTHWLSYRQSSDEMAESFAQVKMLCWVLIAFIGVIGVLNIINTVYSNIHTRVGEIGMQRAIGMSAASLYKTFLWEGAYYAIFASVIGAVLGYVCCIFVGAAKTDTLQLVTVPVMAIIEVAVVSVAACLLATAIPLRSIAKMNIVESIENVE